MERGAIDVSENSGNNRYHSGILLYTKQCKKVEQGMEYERNCRKKEQVTALFSFFAFRKSSHML